VPSELAIESSFGDKPYKHIDEAFSSFVYQAATNSLGPPTARCICPGFAESFAEAKVALNIVKAYRNIVDNFLNQKKYNDQIFLKKLGMYNYKSLFDAIENIVFGTI